MQPPARCGQRTGEAGIYRDASRAECPSKRSRIEHGVSCDVERTARVTDDRAPIGVASVERMHRLEAQARNVGHEADPAWPNKRTGHERSGEQSPDPGCGFTLEDQARPQP